MSISEDALAQAAATLTAALIEQNTYDDTPQSNAARAVKQFNFVMAELSIHHAPETGRQSVGRAMDAIIAGND